MIEYQPRNPRTYNPAIALIGCGGITQHHLNAYKNAGYKVVALCDVDAARAEARRQEFFPEAQVYTDAQALLRRDDIEVVDIATHPAERVPLLHAALGARKHVLSQKPFVLDLDEGERLVELAERNGVKLAVNQNGRWAPHVAYMRGLVAAGELGAISSVDLSVHWDHNWVVGTVFDNIDDLILYDFAIHWFDMVSCYLPNQAAERVYAQVRHSPHQKARPPLLAHVAVEYAHAQVTMSFNADTRIGSQDRTHIVGDAGAVLSSGSGLQSQQVTVYGAAGQTTPTLSGAWFPDGFHGTMAELLCAIEENRQPSNSGANNLHSLALCFAAIASSRDGLSYTPGDIRRLPN
ncbi:MAG: Gfo/Idh/MocA family oxidoreductase [Chloroflexales bacterium]|nr:Gfo/Idh/MocA family oxidoreductase [Chloroflexales bacterium]